MSGALRPFHLGLLPFPQRKKLYNLFFILLLSWNTVNLNQINHEILFHFFLSASFFLDSTPRHLTYNLSWVLWKLIVFSKTFHNQQASNECSYFFTNPISSNHSYMKFNFFNQKVHSNYTANLNFPFPQRLVCISTLIGHIFHFHQIRAVGKETKCK